CPVRWCESDACFNGATAFQPWKAPHSVGRRSGSTSLQWGHGVSAVERRTVAARRLSSWRGFNGATAFQPWKVPGEKLLRSRRFSKRVSSGGWGLPTTCAVAIGTRELGCKDGATSRNHWFEW